MTRDERIKNLKKEFKKNIQKLDTLIRSCDRKKDYSYCIDVIRLYFYTRDKLTDLLPKIQKI